MCIFQAFQPFFKVHQIKRSTGVQSAIKHEMPNIAAVSPKIDRKGIKIIHPSQVRPQQDIVF